MRDPFKPNTNKQLVREAQFGFTVIGLLVATLIYVAWFRLGGADLTPQSIREAPIASQVFPNSPNYDRESHQMVASEKRLFPKSNFASVKPAKAPEIVRVPKRMMKDSRNTARSLSNMADSVDESVNKVASMIKPSPMKHDPPMKLEPEPLAVAKDNPASRSNGDSGFKILKQPMALVEKISVPEFKPPAIAKVEPPKVEVSNDFKPLVEKALPVNTFAPLSPVPKQPNTLLPVETPKFGASKLKLPELPISTETVPFNLQPIKPKVDSSTAPPAPQFKPAVKTSRSPFPEATAKSFAELPARPLSELRAPVTDLREPAVAKATAPIAKPAEPLVKTVSFETSTWVVKKGDSFWSIAKSSYGDPRFFRALYQHNRRVVPGFEDLNEGVELEIPTEAELINRFSDLCPADAVHRNDTWRETPDEMMEVLTDSCESDLDERLYETKAGDTLFGVARRQLGQASRYVELIDLNRFRIDENVTHETELPTGIQLLLPAK